MALSSARNSSVPLWLYWGGGLVPAAVALYLALYSGPLLEMIDLVRIWQKEPEAAVVDANPPDVAEPPRLYSLYFADPRQALILFNRTLIVVHPGAALPDGSHIANLSPDRLVTTKGRTLHVHRGHGRSGSSALLGG